MSRATVIYWRRSSYGFLRLMRKLGDSEARQIASTAVEGIDGVRIIDEAEAIDRSQLAIAAADDANREDELRRTGQDGIEVRP